MWQGTPVIATAVAVVAGAIAQSPTPAPPAPRPVPLQHAVDVPARQLGLKIGLDRVSAGADGKVALLIDVVPDARVHVYAPGETDYLPIGFSLDPAFAGASAPAAFPPASRAFLPAVSQVVRVYDAPFRISQDVTLPADTARAPATVIGTLKYQACDDTVCYRPETVKLTWQIPRE